MFEAPIQCPNCQNIGYIDHRNSVIYCKSKSCNNLVIERGKITFENEVNLHENEDQGRKQTRVGAFESKKEAFKSTIVDILQKNDAKGRRAFEEKFDDGEKAISNLARHYRQTEALEKEVQMKYREFLLNYAQVLFQKNFKAVGAVAFLIVINDKKRYYQDDRHMNRITIEKVASRVGISTNQIHQAANSMEKSLNNRTEKDFGEEARAKAEQYGFSPEELNAIRQIPKRLMDQAIIRGEKPQTIIAVCIYLVSQLSSNPRLNSYTADQLAQENVVTKDTVRKLWNTVVENLNFQASQQLIPDWPGRRQLSELKALQ